MLLGIENDTQQNLIDSLSHLQMEAKAIEMTIKPTAEQKKRLRSFIGAVGGNVDVDFMDANYNTAHSASYEGVSPARVLSGITSFYDEGIKPKGNVSESYSIVGVTGAANLDAAEEATTRLDKLAVAREMEEEFSVEKVNTRFNEELQRQINGTLPQGHIYKMGMPSDILLACGFPEMPIELSATHLQKKASASHHPYELADVKNLVKALNNPLAVFEYGDKLKSQNAIVELVRNNKHFVVGVHFNQDRKGLIVSDIRGLYPKDNAEWLNWISQGKALSLDKNRIQDLINKQQKNLAEVEYLDLDLVTKLIQDFENPTIKPQNFAKKIKLATGWERGADGKWRYEIGDIRYSLNRDTTIATPEMEAEANEELSKEVKLLAELDDAQTPPLTCRGYRFRYPGLHDRPSVSLICCWVSFSIPKFEVPSVCCRVFCTF